MDKMEVSSDTEFAASICSARSHKHLGLGAGVAAVVKKGAASWMAARTAGRATSSTISSTSISTPNRALGDTARLSGHPGIRTTRARPPRGSCR